MSRVRVTTLAGGEAEVPVVELANAGHFLQEDEPELLVAMIQQFMQST